MNGGVSLNDKSIYDITIIGGGPVGLFAAFYGGMRQMKVKIIESLPHLGGQLSALYPEKYIYDVAAYPKVKAQDLIDQLTEQAMQFSPTVVLNQTVEKVVKINSEHFQLTTDKEVHYSKTILITAGIGAFEPRRIKLANALAYEGKNLHYFVQDIKRYKGKDVCILGGGDSAVDWAMMIEPIAKSVTVIHRREQFRAHEHSVANLYASRVEIFTPFQLQEIYGEEQIEEIILQKVKGTEKIKLSLDELIVSYGFISSLGPIKKWGLEFAKNSIKVDSAMNTNIRGIYAAGDVVTFFGKVKLIASGFGDAATAISSAKTYIDPNARQQPQHSTTLFEKWEKVHS
ncbi:NAD(P)/FAD-dependent oxidoreductase [Virgibacillus pantothenticus]|uniref:Ferredoxin--NADP reductase n=1 Tax=Virgibacillus pantothenticus TaxID=1473 RepID=A0A0L0QLL6_VIRPA|nr:MULTISPECIES: NAD(P)/FAD-dependent oxidoreductase [Virgibacillus]API93169.1 ferredoxin--NADP(+) reductase [Virgibacillus sp. 6R]KNE19456.1 ferredoxin-NADP reductase [Virgibacillus pantothenticus]MBS7428789.1 NAD(P)/FAD-dependent oxidoreductase [Virgibacillus sp. 19R1-5]MED3737109.1 NAD(P)/FAD-dependent oxidoreductase [Virgibacillus pantothenticus]QTY15020.1 NAD(P)/FAD-dependent oxidoreductase [Virgibacillus pantothenticus]